MYTVWTKHLKTDEEVDNFRRTLKGSKEVLDRLTGILSEEEQSLNRSETDVRTFDVANWPYLQAYKNGCRAQLNMLKKLIDLDQQEH